MMLTAWLPAMAWMAAIRVAAALPAGTRSDALDSGGRLGDLPGALLHLVVYAILAWAFTLALWNGATARLRCWALQGAFLLTTAYGAMDEYHQTFLPAHGGWPDDIGWDALGAILALVPLQLVYVGNWGQSVRRRLAALSVLGRL